MAYGFNFDLSRISRDFFTAVARMSYRRKLHKRIGEQMRTLIEHFRIGDLTGLNVNDALTLIEDLAEVYTKNLSGKEDFLRTRSRALLLPHCARKFMDGRCKASFNSQVASYTCAHCSPDCLVNQACVLGEGKGYTVHILPGGSCIVRVLKQKGYDGVIGVACCEELKRGMSELDRLGLETQGIPLTKNGCADTKFNLESLAAAL